MKLILTITADKPDHTSASLYLAMWTLNVGHDNGNTVNKVHNCNLLPTQKVQAAFAGTSHWYYIWITNIWLTFHHTVTDSLCMGNTALKSFNRILSSCFVIYRNVD